MKEVSEADILMTLRPYFRSRQQTILDAEERGLPIYVLRANTVGQIEQTLMEIYNIRQEPGTQTEWDSMSEITQTAIQAVMNGQRFVDLPSASPTIRRLQHEMARQSQLVSHSYGKDPNRHVRIFRD